MIATKLKAQLDHIDAWTAKNTRRFGATMRAGVLTIDVFDVIGQSLFTDGVTPQMLAERLDKSASEVLVRINSPGGIYSDGLAMHSLLKEHPGKVTAEVIGEAASAASLVMLGADHVRIHTGAHVMIHEAATVIHGPAAQLEKAAKELMRVSASAAQIYAAKTGKPVHEILQLMAAETYFSADEALEAGLVDEVVAAPKGKPKTTNMGATMSNINALEEWARSRPQTDYDRWAAMSWPERAELHRKTPGAYERLKAAGDNPPVVVGDRRYFQLSSAEKLRLKTQNPALFEALRRQAGLK